MNPCALTFVHVLTQWVSLSDFIRRKSDVLLLNPVIVSPHRVEQDGTAIQQAFDYPKGTCLQTLGFKMIF